MLGDVILIRFQNISCYCLTTTCRFFVTCFLISKHLMLLFNSLLLQSHSLSSFISKHLMLLFNILLVKSSSSKGISKHLMLLFNTVKNLSFFCLFSFQNISCYCLTPVLRSLPLSKSISKHLMLLFNIKNSLASEE